MAWRIHGGTCSRDTTKSFLRLEKAYVMHCGIWFTNHHCWFEWLHGSKLTLRSGAERICHSPALIIRTLCLRGSYWESFLWCVQMRDRAEAFTGAAWLQVKNAAASGRATARQSEPAGSAFLFTGRAQLMLSWQGGDFVSVLWKSSPKCSHHRPFQQELTLSSVLLSPVTTPFFSAPFTLP